MASRRRRGRRYAAWSLALEHPGAPGGELLPGRHRSHRGVLGRPDRRAKGRGRRGRRSTAQRPASITARDYSFTTSGLKAGKNAITFENTGKEPHHVVVAPLKPGKTLDDVRKFAREEKGPPPIDEKSTQSTTVLDGGTKQVTELELKKPGKYALLCFITDRAGGPPHVAKGMAAEATIR